MFSAIRTLARNDANKKLLVHLGALELLVELMKGDEEEQTGKLTQTRLCSILRLFMAVKW